MLTNHAYQSIPAVSSHLLIECAKSPAACWRRYMSLDSPEIQPTDAMQFGTAVHALALTPRRFAEEVIVAKFERRSNAGKAAFSRLMVYGKAVIKPADYDRARSVVAALHADYDAKRLLRRGRPERVVRRDRGAGLLPLKGRIDRHDARRRTVIELKTCRSIDFADASIRRYGYLLSAAFYAHLVGALHVVFVFVESSAPYRVRVFQADRHQLQEGCEQWQSALRTFDECWQKGEWPEAEAADDDDDLTMSFMPAKPGRKRFELPVGELEL